VSGCGDLKFPLFRYLKLGGLTGKGVAEEEFGYTYAGPRSAAAEITQKKKEEGKSNVRQASWGCPPK
jgi:hypothetical protein